MSGSAACEGLRLFVTFPCVVDVNHDPLEPRFPCLNCFNTCRNHQNGLEVNLWTCSTEANQVVQLLSPKEKLRQLDCSEP